MASTIPQTFRAAGSLPQLEFKLLNFSRLIENTCVVHTTKVTLEDPGIEMHAVRSSGAGGQNVNKVATTVHLFFDVRKSLLSDACKARILGRGDHRMTAAGIIVIKAGEYRSQEKNREAALRRLREFIRKATAVEKKRKATRPTRASKVRRVEAKTQRSRTKALRGKVDQ